MNTLISIIIPVYNSEEYLETCFRSILKQTYSYFEVIIINEKDFAQNPINSI